MGITSTAICIFHIYLFKAKIKGDLFALYSLLLNFTSVLPLQQSDQSACQVVLVPVHQLQLQQVPYRQPGCSLQSDADPCRSGPAPRG